MWSNGRPSITGLALESFPLRRDRPESRGEEKGRKGIRALIHSECGQKKLCLLTQIIPQNLLLTPHSHTQTPNPSHPLPPSVHRKRLGLSDRASTEIGILDLVICNYAGDLLLWLGHKVAMIFGILMTRRSAFRTNHTPHHPHKVPTHVR